MKSYNSDYGDILIHNPGSNHNNQVALIAEGGALRTIYSVGVLDYFISQNFYPFNQYIGVSAGASNLAAYLGKKHGRNHQIFTDYCLHPQFKDVSRFLKGGNLIDIDWLWEVTEAQLPIGQEQINQHGSNFKVVMTCAQTAKAHYVSPKHNELFQALKASGNMPFAYKGQVLLHGKHWFDGGVADSIPAQYAYEQGARKIIILRSNAYDYKKKPMRIHKLFTKFRKEHPEIHHMLNNRHNHYNQTLEFIRRPPEDCEIIEVCPPKSIKLGQFTTDIERLNHGYHTGVQMGELFVKKQLV